MALGAKNHDAFVVFPLVTEMVVVFVAVLRLRLTAGASGNLRPSCLAAWRLSGNRGGLCHGVRDFMRGVHDDRHGGAVNRKAPIANVSHRRGAFGKFADS